MPSSIKAPSGLSLNPAPPKATKVSRRAAFAFGGMLTIVVAIIFYGAYKRSKQQSQDGATTESSNTLSSLNAGKNLKKELTEKQLATSTISKDSKTAPTTKDELTPPPLETVPDLNKNAPALPVTSGGPGSTSYHEPTAEEKRRLLAYQREMEAINAPTTVQTSLHATSGPGPLAPASNTMSDILTAAFTQRPSVNGKTLQDAITAALRGPGQDTGAQDQNDKELFLEKARQRREETYLKSTRLPQLSLYEIKAGWDIPGVLEQALNSDLPGEVRALVRTDIYDTATGAYLLIPQGARLVGFYNSNISYGQDGLQVVWSRLIYPDGSSIVLDGMNGQDEKGASGFRHDVDHHYKRLFGTALLTSLFAAGLQLSQNTGQQNVLTTPPPGQVAAQAVGQQVTQLGIDITRKNLNVAPTIKIPIGYRFNVRVNRDMLFDRPYVRDTLDLYKKSGLLLSSQAP